MNTTTHAMKVGAGRGWTELLLSLRNPQDLGFYLVVGLVTVGYLYANRNAPVEALGIDLTLPAVALPSVIGAWVVFGALIGPAYSLSIEREDGTLLRAKAVPHGMIGYVTGQTVFQSLSSVPGLAIILVPGLFLFPGVMHGGVAGWLSVVGYIGLGLLAGLPWGMILGAIMRSPKSLPTWGITPIIILIAISGIFVPFAALADWVQRIAQVFPVYWLGLGMRSAFLPDPAVGLEVGDSWRTLETVAVLAAWAVAGLLLAPIVLRRMARRESGAAIEARRNQALQRI